MNVVPTIALAGLLLITPTLAMAGNDKTPPGQRDSGSWGQVTSNAIAGGFDQGAHASDPNNNGKGPGDPDQPRAGLANAGGKKGDLSNTMDALGLSVP